MGPPLDPGATRPDTTTESKGKVPTDDDAGRRRVGDDDLKSTLCEQLLLLTLGQPKPMHSTPIR